MNKIDDSLTEVRFKELVAQGHRDSVVRSIHDNIVDILSRYSSVPMTRDINNLIHDELDSVFRGVLTKDSDIKFRVDYDSIDNSITIKPLDKKTADFFSKIQI